MDVGRGSICARPNEDISLDALEAAAAVASATASGLQGAPSAVLLPLRPAVRRMRVHIFSGASPMSRSFKPVASSGPLMSGGGTLEDPAWEEERCDCGLVAGVVSCLWACVVVDRHGDEGNSERPRMPCMCVLLASYLCIGVFLSAQVVP